MLRHIWRSGVTGLRCLSAETTYVPLWPSRPLSHQLSSMTETESTVSAARTPKVVHRVRAWGHREQGGQSDLPTGQHQPRKLPKEPTRGEGHGVRPVRWGEGLWLDRM